MKIREFSGISSVRKYWWTAVWLVESITKTPRHNRVANELIKDVKRK